MCALRLTRHLFELSTITAWEWVMVAVAAVVWALVVRLIWRSHLLDRLSH
jgi:hypothetical protein